MWRCIAIVVSITMSVAFAQPNFNEWEHRMLRGAHASAAEFAVSIAEQHVESSVWAFRASAALAQAGDLAGAIRWLESAADRGYSGLRTIETDSYLDPIRRDEAFGRIRGAIRANAEKRSAPFRKAAEAAEPITVLPPRHDATVPSPLVIALHGTGQTGRAMSRAWQASTRRLGAILIAPDALRPSGSGYAWVYRDESEWYVEKIIADAKRDYAISGVIVVGFSQGANIAMAMGRSHPHLFDAVVPICGHWESDVSSMPAAPADGEPEERPAWNLMIGDRDPWHTTYDVAEQELSDAGMRVTMRKVAGMGHAMPPTRVLFRALEWCLEAGDADDAGDD